MKYKEDECRLDCRICTCISDDIKLMRNTIESSMHWIEIGTQKPNDNDVLLLCSIHFHVFFPMIGSFKFGNFYIDWNGQKTTDMTHYCVIKKPA